MPIVDAENRLIGIAAMDDLLEALAGELTGIARLVSRKQSPGTGYGCSAGRW